MTQYKFETCTVATIYGAQREIAAGVYPVAELSVVTVQLGPSSRVDMTPAEFSRLKLERLAMRV